MFTVLAGASAGRGGGFSMNAIQREIKRSRMLMTRLLCLVLCFAMCMPAASAAVICTTPAEIIEAIRAAVPTHPAEIKVYHDGAHLASFRDSIWRNAVESSVGIEECDWSWTRSELWLENISYAQVGSIDEIVSEIKSAAETQPATIVVGCDVSHLPYFRDAAWRAATNAAAGIASCEWSWSDAELTLSGIKYVERITLNDVVAAIKAAAEAQPATIVVDCDVSHLPSFRDAAWRAATNAAAGIAGCEWSWSNTRLTLSGIKYLERVTLEEVVASIKEAAAAQPATIEVECDNSHLPTFRDAAWRAATNAEVGIAGCEWSWSSTKLTLSNIKYVERITLEQVVASIQAAAEMQPASITVPCDVSHLPSFRDAAWRAATNAAAGIAGCEWSWGNTELKLTNIKYVERMTLEEVVASIKAAAEKQPAQIVVDCDVSHLPYFRDNAWRVETNAAVGIAGCEWNWSSTQLTLSGIKYVERVTLEEVIASIKAAAETQPAAITVPCDVSHLPTFRDAGWRVETNAAVGIASCEWSWGNTELNLTNIKYVERVTLEEVIASIKAAAETQPATITVPCDVSHLPTFRDNAWRVETNAAVGIASCEWSWGNTELKLSGIKYIERVTLEEVIASIKAAAETQPATITVPCDVSHLPTFRDNAWRVETNKAVGIASCEWSWGNTELKLTNIKYVERVTLEEVIASIKAAAEDQPATITVPCDVSHLPTFRDNAWRVETNKAVGIASCEWSWANTELKLSGIKYIERVTLEEVIASIKAAAEEQPATITVPCDVSHLPTFRDNAWRVETNKALGIASCEWSWGNTKLTLSGIKYVERMTLEEVVASIKAAAETQPASISVAHDVSHLEHFRDAAWRAQTNKAVGIAACEWNWSNTELNLTNIKYVERMTLDEVIASIADAAMTQPEAITVPCDVSHLPTFRDAAWRAQTNKAVGIAGCEWSWGNTELKLTNIKYVERMTLDEVAASIVSAALVRPVTLTVEHDVSHIPAFSDEAWRASVCGSARIISCEWSWTNTALTLSNIVYAACITPEEICASIEEAAMAQPEAITVEHDSTQFDSIRDAAWRSAAMRSAGIASAEWNWSTTEIWLTKIKYISAAFCKTEEDVRNALLNAQNGSADLFLSKELYASLTANEYAGLNKLEGYAGIVACDVNAFGEGSRLLEIRNMAYAANFDRMTSVDQLRAYMTAHAQNGAQKFAFYCTEEVYAQLLKDHLALLHLIEKECGIIYCDMKDHADRGIMAYQNVQYYPGYFDYVNSAVRCETKADVQSALLAADGKVILYLTEELYAHLTANDMLEFDDVEANVGLLSYNLTYIAGNRCLWELSALEFVDNFELITSVEQLREYFAARSAEQDNMFGFGCTEEVFKALEENDGALLRSIEAENGIEVNGLTVNEGRFQLTYDGVKYVEGFAEFVSTAVKCGNEEEMKMALQSDLDGSINIHLTEEFLARLMENDQALLNKIEGEVGILDKNLSQIGANECMWQYTNVVYAQHFSHIDSLEAMIAYLKERTQNSDGQFAFYCNEELIQQLTNDDMNVIVAYAGIEEAQLAVYEHLNILSFTDVKYCEGYVDFVENAAHCLTLEDVKAALLAAEEEAELDLYLDIALLEKLAENDWALCRDLFGAAGLYDYALEYYQGNNFLWRFTAMEYIRPYGVFESVDQVVQFITECMKADETEFGFACTDELFALVSADEYALLSTVELNAGIRACGKEAMPYTRMIKYSDVQYFPQEDMEFLRTAVYCSTVEAVENAVKNGGNSVNLFLSDELYAHLYENNFKNWHQALGRIGVVSYKMDFYGENLTWWQVTDAEFAPIFAYVTTEEELKEYIQQRVNAHDTAFAFACDEALFNSYMLSGMDDLTAILTDCGVAEKTLNCYGNTCMVVCSDIVYAEDAAVIDSQEELNQFIYERTEALESTVTFVLDKNMFSKVNKKGYELLQSIMKNCGVLSGDVTTDKKTRTVTIENMEYMPGKRIVALQRAGMEAQFSAVESMLYQQAMAIINHTRAYVDSEYALFIELHDAVIDQTTYEPGKKYDDEKYAINETAQGALLYGRADDKGYADAMYLLGNLAGLDVHYQSGTNQLASSDGEYMWNLIRFDGKAYFADLTADDAEDIQMYGLSNIGKDIAKDCYKWEEDAMQYQLEEETGSEYYYYYRENCAFTAYEQVHAYINQNVENGLRSFTFMLKHNGKQRVEKMIENIRTGVEVGGWFRCSEADNYLFVRFELN